MPQGPLKTIRERAFKAVARGRAATIHSVLVKLEVGLTYCELAAITSEASKKFHYQDKARISLCEALRLAAGVFLESDVLVHDEFLAAANLLQQALAKLEAEVNRPTPKCKNLQAEPTRYAE